MSYFMIEENVGPGYITWPETYTTEQAAQRALSLALGRMRNPDATKFRVQEYNRTRERI